MQCDGIRAWGNFSPYAIFKFQSLRIFEIAIEVQGISSIFSFSGLESYLFLVVTWSTEDGDTPSIWMSIFQKKMVLTWTPPGKTDVGNYTLKRTTNTRFLRTEKKHTEKPKSALLLLSTRSHRVCWTVMRWHVKWIQRKKIGCPIFVMRLDGARSENHRNLYNSGVAGVVSGSTLVAPPVQNSQKTTLENQAEMGHTCFEPKLRSSGLAGAWSRPWYGVCRDTCNSKFCNSSIVCNYDSLPNSVTVDVLCPKVA